MDKTVQKIILGDGNCLFRCFSFFLYNNDIFYNRVRKIIVDYMSSHWNEFQDFTHLDKATYILNMSRDREYGTNLEIQAFVKLYDVNIKIICNHNDNYYYFGRSESNYKLVLLYEGQIDNGHYNIINCLNHFNNPSLPIEYKGNCSKHVSNASKNIKVNICQKVISTSINKKKNSRTYAKIN